MHSASFRNECKHNDYSVDRSEDQEQLVNGQYCRTDDGKPKILMKKGNKREHSGDEYSDSKYGKYYFKFFHRVYTCLL